MSAAQGYRLYDARCVDAKLTQTASVCIIDSLCYEDGLINPANYFEGCSVARNMTSWTAVVHHMLKPSDIELTLTGPDQMTVMMTCALPAPAATDLTVDWLMNGVKIFSQTLASGEDHVEKLLLDFIEILAGNPGKLSCQVEDNSVSPPRKMISQETTLVVS
ncbi:hypothetical protein ElyMa_006802300 [Elysia marginata]|uniref:Ig-like domain-containing protein n=1 Tax=Elysia marginata TaxID=1093978 RepID=A0AAV4J3W6_9GAST|nr:hypothetical protein ElyMa_006802300 [Elysia marginata]